MSKEKRFKPSRCWKELIEEGRFGEKSGRGFYKYGAGKEKYHTISVEGPDERGIVTLTLDRQHRLNSINSDMLRELPDAIEKLDEEEVRCLVVGGDGDRAFCSGFDIRELLEASPHDWDETKFYSLFENLPWIVVAKIDGFCLGGGLEIALSADFRIASTRSRFGQPEINLGIMPGGGGEQRLLKQIGKLRTKELVLLGDQIDAEKAEEWGIINKAVPQDRLEEEVQSIVNKIVEGPPVAQKIIKRVINKGEGVDQQTCLDLEIGGFRTLMGTEDAKEGIISFIEDSKPDFRGK